MPVAKKIEQDFFQTIDDLSGPLREAIMLCGRYGTGKTSAMLSVAKYVEDSTAASFYVIDIEQKFRSALEAFGQDQPKNLRYRSVNDMNEATAALDKALSLAKPGDWVGIETMPRLWQGSQDLAYMATEGVTKVEFLERKRQSRGEIKSPIPSPDLFWPIANGSQYGAFLDLLAHRQDINIIATATTKEAQTRKDRKESAERKAIRAELGIDFDIEGAPRMLSYIETICQLVMVGGEATCYVLRDNLSTKDKTRVDFPVPDKKSFATMFFGECR